MSKRALFSETLPRGPKLTEIIANRIRRQIISGDLREGDYLLPEPELMAQFGVSRPTIREALRVLEAELLIRPRRGAHTGAEVRAPSLELSARYNSFLLQYRGIPLADVNLARCILESALAREVVNRDAATAHERLTKLLNIEEQVIDDPIRFGHASNTFHLELGRLAGSETLLLSLEQYYWLLDKQITRVEQVDDPDYHRRANGLAHRAHKKFLRYVREGDSRGAEEFWRSHVKKAGESLLSHFPDKNSSVIDLLE